PLSGYGALAPEHRRPFPTRRSSDLNGRAVRQGNELPVVQIFYYLSDRSMDWYRYTLIQGKRAWLGDVLSSQARDTSNPGAQQALDRKSTRLNSSHVKISYAVFCLKK